MRPATKDEVFESSVSGSGNAVSSFNLDGQGCGKDEEEDGEGDKDDKLILLQSFHEDLVSQLLLIMISCPKFIPAKHTRAFIEALCRVENMYEGVLDDQYTKAVANCDSNGLLLLNMSKVMKRFFAVWQVFAKKLSMGLKGWNTKSNYVPSKKKIKMTVIWTLVQGKVIWIGRRQESVEYTRSYGGAYLLPYHNLQKACDACLHAHGRHSHDPFFSCFSSAESSWCSVSSDVPETFRRSHRIEQRVTVES